MKLIIPGRLPGLNEYIEAERGNRYAAAKMKEDTEDYIVIFANQQIPRPLKTPVYMSYLWIEPDRRRDKSNIAFAKKFIEDALIKAGKLPNDGWKQIKGFKDDFDVDKRNPRVEIEIEEAL